MKISEIPWQLPATLAIAMTILFLCLGLAGFEIQGFGDKPIRIARAESYKGPVVDPSAFKTLQFSRTRFDTPKTIQAFVATGSPSTFVLCQTVSAGKNSRYVREVYCHHMSYRGEDGIYIHIESADDLPSDFDLGLLLYQAEARRYDGPEYAG